MKISNFSGSKLTTVATASLLTILVGCSEGDKSDVFIEGGSLGSADQAFSSSVSQSCPDWASAKNQDNNGNDVCALPQNILENKTLTNDVIWYMDGRITVGNGNSVMSTTEGQLDDGTAVINVTLTIEEGTEIKAEKGTFANLIITRGSKIEAVGTASQPIVFSSDDNDYTGAGEWGGLILHGYAKHNDADYTCSGSVICQNVYAEGESGYAGGNSDDDSSGTLKYVVVTEGGYEFRPDNEINGISFVAVGAGTVVEYIQVNDNADDGVEFYGGNVNAKYIVLTGNLDDSVDWDEGYQGNLQYVIVKQSADSAGNAVEADTQGTTDFYSIPTIANATFIGAGEKDTLMVFKKVSGGFLTHSVFTGASGSTIAVCADVSNSADTTTLMIFDNANNVQDCNASSGLGSLAAAYVTDVDLDANYASAASQASGLAPFNITNFRGAYGLSGNTDADASFTFDATDFAGAINPDGSDVWYQGWIVEGSL